jgi:hypothetical protein
MYIKILHRLRDAVVRKSLEKWELNIWFLWHDNAPAHWWLVVKKYLAICMW